MLVGLIVFLNLLELVCSQQMPSSAPSTNRSSSRIRRTIKIGGLFVDDNSTYSPFVGYTGSIGALYVAIDRIREAHLLDDFDFNITIRYDNCVERDAVGLATELIRDFQVDAIIGPTCNVQAFKRSNLAAIAVGVMAAYYNLPHYIWGFTTANELAYVPRFPTVIILTPNYFTYVDITADVFEAGSVNKVRSTGIVRRFSMKGASAGKD
ncbi:hypothetical protein ANCCEY_11164 [Ancylostoma ceylanicum]|uniref:Receptor ligand binding region domain-containing protein n=1 Tax=Ancylostoma ceylanicum TaxID=53326 RepID=A0A0D6LII3_9BILA|nr:hypothetical protein ANCCEY_11164 [Ancylostoma ceylanicum]